MKKVNNNPVIGRDQPVCLKGNGLSVLWFITLSAFLSLPGFAQLLSYSETFNDDQLNGWGWNEDQTTYLLNETGGVLEVSYNRSESSWEWDNFNFTPPGLVNVVANPIISLEARSDVVTDLTVKPVYTDESDDFITTTLPGDHQWHNYEFQLSNAGNGPITRVYFYLDGGSTSLVQGSVGMDNLNLGAQILAISQVQATALDSSSIQLSWSPNDPGLVATYRVYFSQLQGFFPGPENLLAELADTSFLHTGLQNNTRYFYRITGVDLNGDESAPSDEISAQTFTAGLTPGVAVRWENASSVGLYHKYEIVLDLWDAEYNNPFDPVEIDVRALFVSPTGVEWPIYAFWNNVEGVDEWTVRFAPNEIGTWTYTLTAEDRDGQGLSEAYSFEAVDSDRQGWIHVSENNPHYFVHDAGGSFYPVGVYYPWNTQQSGLYQLGQHDANFFGYWNCTYDGAGNGGGNRLFESMQSGIGHYDQLKCARIEQLLAYAETYDLKMMYAIWPHDAFSETVWATLWQVNPYQFVCDVEDIYSDAAAWAFQEKQYRYLIARFGWSPNLAVWEIMNEINGTDGWATGHQAEATQWTRQVHDYLAANDPFDRPSTASQSGGQWWPQGYEHVDIPNVHVYETSWTPEFGGNPMRSSMYLYHRLSQDFWTNFDKPAIFGEAGYTDSYGNFDPGTEDYLKAYHNSLFASWSSGIAATPVWWDFGLMNGNMLDAMQAFGSIAGRINYTAQSLAYHEIDVEGCDGYAMVGDTLAFGWLREQFGNAVSGKVISLNGLTDGAYTVEWYDAWSGALLLENFRPVSGGNLAGQVPSLDASIPDVAFIVRNSSSGVDPSQLALQGTPTVVLNDPARQVAVTCNILDAERRFCMNATNQIQFELLGPGSLEGAVSQNALNGVAGITYRPDSTTGTALIIASSPGLQADTLSLRVTDIEHVDDFEGYASSTALNAVWHPRVGLTASISLERESVGQALQALRFDYAIGNGNPPYSGIEREVNEAYSGTLFFRFWLTPDASHRTLAILLNEVGVTTWQAFHPMVSDTPGWVSIPLSSFISNDGSETIELGNLESLSFNVLPGSGGYGSGTVYLDDVGFTVSQYVMSTVGETDPALPGSFRIEAVYPNPFNPSTRVSFRLSEAGQVRFQVFDVTGREVHRQDQILQTGSQNFSWDAAGLASGVYIIKLSSGGEVESRKCMLLR